jgi:autotransporter translocation and assembly factor TamB
VRRLFRLLLRLTLGGLALLWLAYTVAYFKFNDAILGDFITKRVSHVNRGQFILRHARYPYWGGLASLLFDTSAHVVGEDFTLLDPDGNPVIRVPIVYADAHIQELAVSLAKTALSGGHRTFITLHFPRAAIPSGWAVIAPTRSTWGHEHVETNIVAAMSARKKSESTGGAFVIRADEVELGEVGFAMGSSGLDGKPSWWAKLDGVHAKAGLKYSSARELSTRDGPYFFFRLVDVTAPAAALQLGEYNFPLEHLRAAEFGVHGDVRQNLHFAADAHALGAGVHAEGALVDAYSEHPGVRLTLDVDHGRGPLALLPAPLSTWLSGDPRARITIAGPFSHPVIDGEVHEIDANLEGLKLTNGSAALHFDEGKLSLHPARGTLARGEASADIDLELRAPGRWSAQVTLKGVDPAEIPKLPKSVAGELAGRLDGRVHLGGNLLKHRERIELTKLGAELQRSRKGGKLPRKLTVAGGAEYTPTKITLRGVTASGDGVTVGADGTLDPRSGRVDAGVRVDASGSSSLVTRLGGPPGLHVDGLHATGRIAGALAHPQLALHAVATNVSYEQRTLEKLEADLSLQGGTLVVNDLVGTGLGATVAGSAELGLFDRDLTRPRATPTIVAKLTLHGLSLAALSGWIGIQGKADVDINLEGALAHPHGRASLTLPRLEIQGDVYTGGSLRLAFSDAGATVEELKLQRARGGLVRGEGRIGWNGEMDLRLLPRDFPLAAIPWVKSVPVALAGTLSGDVHLGGTVDHPVPGGVLSLVAFKIREVLLGKGDLRLDPGTDAIHLSGSFFNNLVTVDGYLTLVPKVSVIATIRVKNLPLEKLIPEMQALAEIHGLATGELGITIDSESGLTFAKLALEQLTLTLTSTDETGRPQRLVVKNQDPVLATYDGKSVDIKHALLYSSIGEFTMHGTLGKVNNVYMRGRIGLELLEYFFRGLFEHTHGPANVELTISGDLARPDITGYIKVGGGKGPAELVPRGLEGKLTLVVPEGRVDVTPQSIRLTGVALSTEKGKQAHASGELQLDHWVPGALQGKVTGEISPKLFQWGLKEYVGDASGSIKLDVSLGGVWSHPEWHGTAEVKDVLFRARKLERDIRLDGGTVAFDNFDVAIGCPRTGQKPQGCRSLTGLIDEDSKVTAVDGRISFGDELALKRLDVWVDGSEIDYHQPGWSVKFSPQVELQGNGNGLTLRGNINLVEGRYAQNFDLVGMIFRPRINEVAEPFWQGLPLLETLRLSLRVQSAGALIVKNNLADLSLAAALDISGTLSEPRFDGTIALEEGGRINPPGFRYTFETRQGLVRFEADRKIPDETPTIDLYAEAPYIDRNEQQHTLWMKLSGTALSPRLDLGSLDGWEKNQVLALLLAGQSPEDIRRIAQGVAAGAPSAGVGSPTDTVTKTITGFTLGQFISDPLRRQIGLDVVNVQFGGSSFQLDACKRLGRQFKACGQGEIGFAGSSRFGGSIEFRLSDRPAEWSGVGRVEYLTRGVETLQDSLTSGRGELKLRVPLGY